MQISTYPFNYNSTVVIRAKLCNVLICMWRRPTESSSIRRYNQNCFKTDAIEARPPRWSWWTEGSCTQATANAHKQGSESDRRSLISRTRTLFTFSLHFGRASNHNPSCCNLQCFFRYGPERKQYAPYFKTLYTRYTKPAVAITCSGHGTRYSYYISFGGLSIKTPTITMLEVDHICDTTIGIVKSIRWYF